jgi:uncharacterized delta-60 repeat protein
MPNAIKFSSNTSTNSLRKGSASIGINNVSYAPTSETGFWNGIDAPIGGYVVYQERTGADYNAYGFSAAVLNNDAGLINYAKGAGGEATTNQYQNPAFENSTTSWQFGSWDNNIFQYSVETVTGPLGNQIKALKITKVSSSSGPAHFHQGNGGKYLNGKTYSLSAYVKGSGIFGKRTQSGFTGNTGNESLTENWKKVEFTVLSSTSTNYPYWDAGSITLNIPMYFTLAQSEEKSYSTWFVNGTRTEITTAPDALFWIDSQPNLFCANRNYEDIVTDGLALNLDANFVASYPATGATWYDLGPSGNNGTLVNGPIFNSSGWITFDGSDDRFNYNTAVDLENWSFQGTFLLNFEKIKSTQLNTFASNSAGLTPGNLLFELSYSVFTYSIVVDGNGNVFVGGRITEYNGTSISFIIKTDSSGNLVTAFNTGLTLTQTQAVTGLQLDASGNLYYVGYNFGNLVRISATSGSQLQAIATVNATITQANLLLDSANNKAYIGGWFTSIQGTAAQRIARINMPGMTIDTSFNTTTGFVNEEDVQMMALQSDGKLIVGGQFTSYKGSSYNRIIRLNSDATIDTSFNPGTGFNNTVIRNCIAIQSDGKIIVGGNFTTYNGTSANRIIRLNSDGSIDTGFVYGTGFDSNVTALALDSNGKIVVAGQFQTYNGSSRNRIIRLNTNGTIDTGFSIGTGFSSSVGAIAIQSDGKILVGGEFSAYNGSTANQLCRLNSDGTIDSSFSSGTGILGGYRLNCQLGFRNSSNFLTAQFFYAITRPTGYDWRSYETAVSPFLGRFINWAITKNSSNQLNLYWNGIVNNTTNVPSPTNLRFQINRSGTMKGNLDRYSLYNKQLSQAEILQNYYQGPIVTSGLSFYLDAGNLVSYPAGGTASYSLTGTVTGSLQNGVGFSPQNGGFWNFDGSNDRILLSSSINMGNGSTPWTISAWVRTTTTVTGLGQGTIISNQSGGPVYSQLCINGGKITYWSYKTSWVQYLGNTTINTGNWVNLVWRNNVANTMTFFVNGVFDGTVSDSSIGGPATNPLDSIGRYVGQNSFAGDISMLMIYTSALTQSEIGSNYNLQRIRYNI